MTSITVRDRKKPTKALTVLEKIVANPDNGAVPVFHNALPDTVMAILRSDPGPFWRSFRSSYETTPARFGGRFGRPTKRPRPV
jgi:hypothetical protein